MPSMVEHANVTELMQVMIAKLANGNPIAARALKTRFGLGGGFSPLISLPNGASPGLKQLPTLLAGLIGLIGWVLLLMVVFISIQVAAMWDIVKDPTISSRVSFWVVIYVVLVDAAIFAVTMMNSTGFAATE